jgi:ABC-type glycerol-3-phosphate transport system substrate-binding protein
MEDGRPAFDASRNAELLAQYAGLVATQPVISAQRTSENGETHSLLSEQQAAMWVDDLGGARLSNTGIAPLPQEQDYAALDVIWAGYISAGTQAPKAAWQWLVYLTHHPTPYELLPVRPTVLQALSLDQESRATYNYILERMSAKPWPGRHVSFSDAYLWLRVNGIEAVIEGDASPTEVLQHAQSLALDTLDTHPGAVTEETLPTVVPPPTPDEQAIRTLVGWDIAPYQAVADRYVASLETPLVVTIEGFLATVRYPPEKRAEFDVFRAPQNLRVSEVEDHWLNLQPFIESDTSFELNDFYPQALEAYLRNGELWALPTEIDTDLLCYNRAIFDAANVAYPEHGWTWDDLAVAAGRLSIGEGNSRQWGFVTVTDGWESHPLIKAAQQAGKAAPLVDDPDQPTKPTLNTAPVVESVRWYAALSQDLHVMPLPAVYVRDWQRPSRLIHRQRAAMWICNIGMLSSLKNFGLNLENVGVAPLPVSGSPLTTYSVGGYGLSAQSARREASWAWLVHLTQQPSITRAIPARQSLRDQALSSVYPGELRDNLREVFQIALDTYEDGGFSAARTGIYWYDVAYRLYRLAVRETLKTGTDPEVTLEAAQEKAEAYITCLQANGQLDGDEFEADEAAACESAADVPPAKVWYED